MNETAAKPADKNKLKTNGASPSRAIAKRSDPAESMISVMEKMMPEIRKVIPKHITAERMTRTILTCIRKTPLLAQTTPESFLGALFSASQLGLEPGPLSHCYLIPYKDNKKGVYECQFQIGYKGYIDLARRSGMVSRIEAHTVRQSDINEGRFELTYGTNSKFRFEPKLVGGYADNDPQVCYVAYLKYKDGSESYTHLTIEEVKKIRDAHSQSAKYASSPWQRFPEAMAHKTVLKKLLKFEKLSPEQQLAVVYDDQKVTAKTDGKDDSYGDFGDFLDVDYSNEDIAAEGGLGDRA